MRNSLELTARQIHDYEAHDRKFRLYLIEDHEAVQVRVFSVPETGPELEISPRISSSLQLKEDAFKVSGINIEKYLLDTAKGDLDEQRYYRAKEGEVTNIWRMSVNPNSKRDRD